MKPKYEYLIQLQGYDPEIELDQDLHTLNLRGEDGWELVSVCGPIESATHGLAWHYFFRRPK